MTPRRRTLAPLLGAVGVGRFRECPRDYFAAHWKHEPADHAVASWTAPVLWRFRLARLQS